MAGYSTPPLLDPPNSVGRSNAGLTEAEVRRLQEILRRECGIDLSIEAAWARAIELLALFRMMLGPIPEDPPGRGSNIRAIDGKGTLSN